MTKDLFRAGEGEEMFAGPVRGDGDTGVNDVILTEELSVQACALRRAEENYERFRLDALGDIRQMIWIVGTWGQEREQRARLKRLAQIVRLLEVEREVEL